MVKPYFTRKNLIVIALSFFYAIMVVFCGVCLDGAHTIIKKGNIIRVFGSIEKNFYDKKKIKDEMNSLTSSSVFMFRMLVSMPIILVLILYSISPTYFVPFFINSIGRMILLLIIILYITYVFVIKKVLKVKLW